MQAGVCYEETEAWLAFQEVQRWRLRGPFAGARQGAIAAAVPSASSQTGWPSRAIGLDGAGANLKLRAALAQRRLLVVLALPPAL